MPARIDDLLVLNANLNKSDFAKYPRDREAVLPNDFGGLGDGVADDRTAIQAAFDRAEADQKFAMIPPGTWNVSGTVTLPSGARGLIMQGTIRYTGTAPSSVLVLGDGGTTTPPSPSPRTPRLTWATGSRSLRRARATPRWPMFS